MSVETLVVCFLTSHLKEVFRDPLLLFVNETNIQKNISKVVLGLN